MPSFRLDTIILLIFVLYFITIPLKIAVKAGNIYIYIEREREQIKLTQVSNY